MNGHKLCFPVRSCEDCTELVRDRAATLRSGRTSAQREVLERAYDRPGGQVCPTPGLGGAAQDSVLDALKRKALVERQGAIVLHITTLGREVVRYLRGEGMRAAAREMLDDFGWARRALEPDSGEGP